MAWAPRPTSSSQTTSACRYTAPWNCTRATPLTMLAHHATGLHGPPEEVGRAVVGSDARGETRWARPASVGVGPACGGGGGQLHAGAAPVLNCTDLGRVGGGGVKMEWQCAIVCRRSLTCRSPCKRIY
eukprot:scaffold20246_cov58-Phaeocystis_antarctica.AAC.11